jgi:hypothetical protein
MWSIEERDQRGRDGSMQRKQQAKLGEVGMKPIPKLSPYIRYSLSRAHSSSAEARCQRPGVKSEEEEERKDGGSKKKGRKKQELTRFSIGETDNHTQQPSHGTMRHDCSIVIEWVDADCSFTHMD